MQKSICQPSISALKDATKKEGPESDTRTVAHNVLRFNSIKVGHRQLHLLETRPGGSNNSWLPLLVPFPPKYLSTMHSHFLTYFHCPGPSSISIVHFHRPLPSSTSIVHFHRPLPSSTSIVYFHRPLPSSTSIVHFLSLFRIALGGRFKWTTISSNEDG